EIVSFDKDGKNELGIIGRQKNANANFIKYILTNSPDNKFLISKLKKRKIDFHNANSCNLFNSETVSGETEELTALENGFIIIAAPGKSMLVDKQEVASDLEIKVLRKNINNKKLDYFLPDPLSDTKEEYLIKDSTALAYEVKEGDFIQVIDIYGQQCSDFMAFNSPLLQKGKEFSIDARVTRSIVGGAYPMPGLFAKYFDKNQDTLVEVIQDTCGRHDTFGTACTLKYYEDMGYFGHPNCSDNYNGQLEPFGVEKRKGWQAINLFFNTSINTTNVLFSDIPWSRPGDYVLFQAQKDLVCVSSACPCDVDAANDWNPTDVYVRVYSKKKIFSKATGYRKNANSDFILTKQTAFHERTSVMTKDMMDSAGFWIPNKYNNYGTIEEYTACRNNVVVMDLSSLR
ncbi:MAG TPA: DUF1989 domain-containing protein, partial [Pelagibacterales bacterium]|nr:DUF1989 domain-containing protein [Pelagibacterales bacterium]